MDLIVPKSKSLWTHHDFETMGWHDCPIYGIRFEDEVLMDIDYILKWELDKESKHYSFWIAPATLVFHEARNLKINIELEFINGLEISDLHKNILNEIEISWKVETQEGDITLVASGFSQYLRKIPILVHSQCLTIDERGGYCFDKIQYKE
jgi:hypothetical protein